MRKHYAATALAVALIAIISVWATASATPRDPAPYCFPAAAWGPEPDRLRPCVRVVRLYEDGSFTYRVSDANGHVRYRARVEALDR